MGKDWWYRRWIYKPWTNLSIFHLVKEKLETLSYDMVELWTRITDGGLWPAGECNHKQLIVRQKDNQIKVPWMTHQLLNESRYRDTLNLLRKLPNRTLKRPSELLRTKLKGTRWTKYLGLELRWEGKFVYGVSIVG